MKTIKKRLEKLEKQIKANKDILVMIAEKQESGAVAATIHRGGGLEQKTFPSVPAFENFLQKNKIDVLIYDNILEQIDEGNDITRAAFAQLETDTLKQIAEGNGGLDVLTDKIKEVVKNGNS